MTFSPNVQKFSDMREAIPSVPVTPEIENQMRELIKFFEALTKEEKHEIKAHDLREWRKARGIKN